MKRLMLFASVLMVAAACWAQDVQFSTHHGFSIVQNVAGSLTWTNDNAYPFKFDSMVFNSSVPNTTVVSRVHSYKINQVRGNVVETNDVGTVETNYYNQITNVLTVAFTNILLSVTNAGAAVYTKDDIKQLWLHAGDVIVWTFSDTSTNTLMYDTTR